MKKRYYSEYLHTGVYTVSDAARLIGVPTHRVRRWLCGDPHDYRVGPLIKNELPVIEESIAMSFVNLIEALFIARFAEYGVHVRSIRAMAEEAKEFILEQYGEDTDHPFATDILFKTDGRDICAEVAKKHNDIRLYSLRKHNYALEPIIGPSLKEAVSYKGLHAHRWYPHKKKAPHVVVNPTASFGQPVLDDSGIPTRVLYDAYLAEEQNESVVAKWFEITKQRVREAVRFEMLVTQAA